MKKNFIYVACTPAGLLDAFTLDLGTGTLKRLESTVQLEKVGPLAAGTDSTQLFAGSNADPLSVVAYSVDSATGQLSEKSRATVPVRNTYLSANPSGAWVYNAGYSDGAVASIALNGADLASTGVLAARPGPQTHSVRASPDGWFIYAAALGADAVVHYSQQPDGTLQELGSLALTPSSGPRHFVFNHDGGRMYVLHEMSGEVSFLERDLDTGELSLVQTVSSIPDDSGMIRGRAHTPENPPLDPALNPIWCADLKIAGNYLFTTERTHSTVSTFAIDSETGRLSYLRSTPTETQPRGMGVDSTGSYILVCGEKSAAVSVYRVIPDDGTLHLTDRVTTGQGPLWIESLPASHL